jgi:Integrase core domain
LTRDRRPSDETTDYGESQPTICARVDSNHAGQGPQPDTAGVDGSSGVQIVHFVGFGGRIRRVGRIGCSQSVLKKRATRAWSQRLVVLARSAPRNPAPALLGQCSKPAVGGDFTHVAMWSGVAYVAFAIDAFSRRLGGWKADSTMTTSLVLDTLEMALWARAHVAYAVWPVVSAGAH